MNLRRSCCLGLAAGVWLVGCRQIAGIEERSSSETPTQVGGAAGSSGEGGSAGASGSTQGASGAGGSSGSSGTAGAGGTSGTGGTSGAAGTSGTGGTAGAGGTGFVCPGAPDGASACEQCRYANCCEAAVACAADPVCSVFQSCLDACPGGDDVCRAQCDPIRSGQTIPDVVAPWMQCQTVHCENECEVSCGGIVGPFLMGTATPGTEASCAACLTNPAQCATARECGQSLRCVQGNICVRNCHPFDDICIFNCRRDYREDPTNPVGAAFIKRSSVEQLCLAANECARGSDWSCLPFPSWPPVQPHGIEGQLLRRRILQYQTNTAYVADANVVQCANPASAAQVVSDCVVLGTQHTSDADGVFKFNAATNVFGSGNFLRVTHDGVNPEFLPTLYYQYPLTSRNNEDPPDDPFSMLLVLPTADQVDLLLTNIPLQRDPSLGILLVVARDCHRYVTQDIDFTLDPAPANLVELKTDPGLSYANYAHIYPNLAPGYYTIHGTLTTDPTMPEVNRIGVMVEAGAVTQVDIVPNHVLQ